jgi:hypothetical protein
MQHEPEVMQPPLQQVRDYLHSTDRDHTTQGHEIPVAHAARTADLRSRAHELGQDALAHADEALALKVLWLIREIQDMDAGLLQAPGPPASHRPAL